MKYDPIAEERKWWEKGVRIGVKSKPLPAKHHFAHAWTQSKLYDTLISLGCDDTSSVLDVGCGSGEDAKYVQKATRNIVGVDVSAIALKVFTAKGFEGILTDVKKLPFHNDSFDYVLCSGLLHHLRGQGDLAGYLTEFVRVTKKGGYVVASEPNVFHPSGILMNIFNTIKPGITGLVPHERALSPLYLTRNFRKAGLKDIQRISASYVWNRLPLTVSKFISKHEGMIRFKKPFNLFGWFVIVCGQKGK
ncbi:class I SAM-dependent methyltransferase [Chloroflexota bacterium]